MTSLALTAAITLAALALEALAGYPDRLFRAIGHPVTWIGALIAGLDRALNRADAAPLMRRVGGILALLVILAVALAGGWLVETLLFAAPLALGIGLTAIAASSLLAQRSLHQHVAAVAKALELEGDEAARLAAGRAAVSRIVGRDTTSLDQSGICRGAIESLAENASDGVVAPAFWMCLLGLPGAAAYKAINTADSMIGHRTPRHEAFGWASARLDDVVNLPASRLSGLLFVAAAALMPAASPRGAIAAIGRDAHRHRSPNAGWPEAATAGALGIAIAGPRAYAGRMTDTPVMGSGGRQALGPQDIRNALTLFCIANGLLAALVAAVLGLVLAF
ncbi:adenosylcobinamide-phosphate synthase CbiB [Acuticoccus sp. MNP-M23]|uniref:adenosylcobinamide-phosphate synthase CbiB n=1 Tax=Acuticoccus sp. MNP-M23 TaxID=3072793 RepID=UPI00281618FB|nr:adenosylcobinamide-phosphate synthase CbiB [Acuticoccus sp. MNP-M23]WMS43276.1 adenosylcobinamide-phosphate synthase CbiB [Acuticoccus sp. MNP-M23]